MLLTQQFNTNATKNLARGAYRYLGKETNYGDLKTRIARLSYLYLHEIGDHARVAFFTRNSPAVIATFFALTNTRSLIIPIDPDRPPEEVIEWLKLSQATHIAVTNDLLGRAREVLQAGRLSLPIVEIEKKQGGEYAASFTPPPDNPPVDTDPVVLFRTAGTTGKSKFVVFNHKQLLATTTGMRGLYHLTSVDRFFSKITWAHPFSFIHAMLFPMMMGATCVIDHGLEGKDFLDFMVESRITRLIGFPPFFLKTLLTCRDEKRRIPAAVKSVTVGLGQLSMEVHKTIELMKISVCHTYGCTEAGWTLAMEDSQQTPDERPSPQAGGHYVGKGLVGLKYKVIDQCGDEITGREVREGLLCVTGPCMMAGYLDNEKETKQAIRGTWLYTGEYARLEGEGETLKITFLARREDVIRQENRVIMAEGIDKSLKGFAGVSDAAGFVLKDSKNVSKFVCAVVRAPGSTLNEKQVIERCGSVLPSDQVPAAVVFTDFIQRDGANNVNRYKLAAQFSGAIG